MSLQNKIEILAPAGSFEKMQAAFMGGADACYIGGKSFGARSYAENLEEDELVKAIEYAHFHGKKLYLTVNTLLKEDELENLGSYLIPYYEAGIDAVLVQDFGVLRYLRENFIDLPIHASTQMTVSNPILIDKLKEYGIERIVLPRELSIEEIKEFKNIEIECFVHGALCVCYSGQCLMSAFSGGRSGNRGSCAGPCRKTYKTELDKRATYTLSPKDLQALDLIPKLAKAGVSSFKIEGRMKKKEYAALTSYLYKKWTECYLERGEEYFYKEDVKRLRERDVLELSDLYNRGGFTNGYFYIENSKEMMAATRPNHYGVFVGRIRSVDTKAAKMQIDLTKEIGYGDVLEIRNEERADSPIYEFTVGRDKINEKKLVANFTKNLPMRAGLSVYRTRNNSLIEKINKEIIKDIKKRIDISFVARQGEEISLTLSVDGIWVTKRGKIAENAVNNSLTEERIARSIGKLGNTPFVARNTYIDLEENIFFPISNLNELRREATEELYNKIIKERKRKFEHIDTKREIRTNFFNKARKYLILISKLSQLSPILKLKQDVELIVDLENFLGKELEKLIEITEKNKINNYLRLPIIFRNSTEKFYSKFFSSKKGRLIISKISGFVVRNIEEIVFLERLKNENIKFNGRLIADSNIYTYNSMAVDSLYDLNVSVFTKSLELSLAETMQIIEKSGSKLGLSVIVYGREEVMTTKQCQWKNRNLCVKEIGRDDKKILHIDDGRGNIFPVKKDCNLCVNYIFTKEPINLIDKIPEKLPIEYIRADFTFETEEEVERVMRDIIKKLA